MISSQGNLTFVNYTKINSTTLFNASVYAQDYSGKDLNCTGADVTEKLNANTLVISDQISEKVSTTVVEDLRTPAV